jgi:hypothetical protein
LSLSARSPTKGTKPERSRDGSIIDTAVHTVLTAGPDVILEAERTLDREVAEMLLLKAGRYGFKRGRFDRWP